MPGNGRVAEPGLVFVIAGSHAALVANDNCDFRYRASSHHLPAGIQVRARSHERAETHFMVVDGMIEFMVQWYSLAGWPLPAEKVGAEFALLLEAGWLSDGSDRTGAWPRATSTTRAR